MSYGFLARWCRSIHLTLPFCLLRAPLRPALGLQRWGLRGDRHPQITAWHWSDVCSSDWFTFIVEDSRSIDAAGARRVGDDNLPLGVSPCHPPRDLVQLRGFNRPFQLGWAPGDEDRFETPAQAEILRVPVELGDVVVCASDGLFDNLTEGSCRCSLFGFLIDVLFVTRSFYSMPADILELVVEWDAPNALWRTLQQPLQGSRNDAVVNMLPPPLDSGRDAAAQALATMIAAKVIWACCNRIYLSQCCCANVRRHVQARERSLDRTRDGPFALLAKEADILWKYGGRPDDSEYVCLFRSSRKSTSLYSTSLPVTVVVAVVSDNPSFVAGARASMRSQFDIPRAARSPEDVLGDVLKRLKDSSSLSESAASES